MIARDEMADTLMWMLDLANEPTDHEPKQCPHKLALERAAEKRAWKNAKRIAWRSQ